MEMDIFVTNISNREKTIEQLKTIMDNDHYYDVITD